MALNLSVRAPVRIVKPLTGTMGVAGTVGYATGQAKNLVRTAGPSISGVTGVTGNIASSAGSDPLIWFQIPTQLDEQNTYDNVLGWTWTGPDKVTNFATTAPALRFDLHNDTEGDGLWTHYQMYKRLVATDLTQANIHLSWAQAWRDYMCGPDYLYDCLHTDHWSYTSGWYDHIYGMGLAYWAVDRGDTVAMNRAIEIAGLIETEALAKTPGTEMSEGRKEGRWWQLATFMSVALWPNARWDALREHCKNIVMQSPNWHDQNTVGIGRPRAGGHYYTYSAGVNASWANAAQYAAGRRLNSSFIYGILHEAHWKHYWAVGGADVQARIIQMAKHHYYYAHVPGTLNPMSGLWWGHEVGKHWQRELHDPGTVAAYPVWTDPTKAYTFASTDQCAVNILVMGYKLTGHKGFLYQAQRHLRVATQYTNDGTGTPYFGEVKQPDNVVDHFIDTRTDSGVGYVLHSFNKGELQYDYLVFENGGNPTVFEPWPPYSVPNTALGVTTINANAHSSAACKPPQMSASYWEYACFNSYAGGAIVEDWSTAGAWCVAGSGGHGAPPNLGACLFDFQDGLWKRVDDSGGAGTVHGIAHQNADFTFAQVDSACHIVGCSPPNLLAPNHYLHHGHQLRTSQGGGPKGSFLVLVSLYADQSSGHSTGVAHKFDLSTGRWSIASTNAELTGVGAEPYGGAYDRLTNRWYLQAYDWFRSNVDYLDGNDMTYKLLNLGGTIPAPDAVSTARNIHIDERRHLMWFYTGNGKLWGVDLDSPVTPVQLSLSGTLPVGGPSGPDSKNDWAYYPPDGCWYKHESTYNDTPSATLYKLQPPAIQSNPLAGTWTVSTLTLSTALQPQDAANSTAGALHYNRLFYVPSLNRLCWIAGMENGSVQLIKPS